MVSQTK